MWAGAWQAPEASDANNHCVERFGWQGESAKLPFMTVTDLNLLAALDVLLAERSVTAAAKRMGLSVSAMSRTLARLRSVTGDPLLVQAGRSLVPTAHAERIADRVHAVAQEALAVLGPTSDEFDSASLDRTFSIRANEGFVALFAPAIVAAIAAEAPRVRLRFAPKPDKVATPFRDGTIDLEVGTAGRAAPEMRSQLLFRDRFIGAARQEHALFAAPITPDRYAAFGHVAASRRGAWNGPVDDALLELGLRRTVVVVVPSFFDALGVARQSDLIALVPQSCIHDGEEKSQGVRKFELPIPTPELAINVMWHPRVDMDPGHRWLRQMLFKGCRTSALHIAGV